MSVKPSHGGSLISFVLPLPPLPSTQFTMEKLERFLSRPTAKPYRARDIEASDQVHLNDDGLLEFGPDDIENPKVSDLMFDIRAVD
jgi:hypothetical protein